MTYKFTLRQVNKHDCLYTAAGDMDGFTCTLPHLPRPGDFIRDPDHGEVEVVKVSYSIDGGDITLYIK